MEQQIGVPGGAEILVILVIILFFAAALLLPTVFYLLTLQKALTRCHPNHRLMQPGLVWLLLIPVFNLVWQFFVVINLAGSLEKEFNARGIETEPAPGKAVGMAMSILNITGMIPYVGILTGIGALVCWIIHWVKIADCSAKLHTTPSSSGS
jgi:hypothetical protein